jgi:F-type H+-transporting ATPase subunit b
MKSRSFAAAACLATATLFGGAFVVSNAFAQAADPHAAPARPTGAQPVPGAQLPQGHPGTPRPLPRPIDPHAQGAAHGAPPHGAAARGAAPQGGHGESGHGEEHGGHGAHDEKAPPPPINWWHGLLGEKAGETPSILWRAPGEPAPFLASLINFAVLLLIVNKYGKKALSDALVKRKENITREIDEATRMRKAAEERLGQYEAKLEKISDELERVRREFREQGERDKARIIAEAKERRERMHKDTELILAQEVKQMRHELLSEIVRDATRLATEILSKNTTLGDHDRFAEAFLHQLRSSARFSVAPAPPVRASSSYPGPAAAKGTPS